MNDADFLATLSAAAIELQRRAEACAWDSDTEVDNLILSNASSGVLIALNLVSRTMSRQQGGEA